VTGYLKCKIRKGEREFLIKIKFCSGWTGLYSHSTVVFGQMADYRLRAFKTAFGGSYTSGEEQ